MLIEVSYLLKKAVQEQYAIGAFSVYNLETALGVARAAVEEYAPLIMQVSETTIEYAGLKPITHIVSTIAKNEAIAVPVALHLDHGRSFKSIAECIAAGFSSVHIDASDLAFDENVRLTREVVDYARTKNVWVLGELGRAPQAATSSRESRLDLKQAEEFVEATGVDSLAVALNTENNSHQAGEHLRLDLLKEVREKVNIPLVIHEVSNAPKKEISQAIALGASIFTVEKAIKSAFCQGIKNKFRQEQNIVDPRALLSEGILAVKDETKKWIKLFRSTGRAER